MKWKTQTIDSVCHKVTSGGTPSRKMPNFYENGTIPWIKTGELNGWYLEDAEEWITEEAIQQSSAKLFPPKTVLMAMYGQGNTITTVSILRQSASTNQACCAMIVNENICHPHFLLYSLKYYKEELLNLALGASQRNLSVTRIANFEIPLPPLEIQHRIAAILSAYDDLIENNKQRIKAFEQAAHDLYREWFVEFRFPGHESVEMVDSGTDYGMIPQGWEVVPLGALYKTSSGGTPSRKKPEYYQNGSIYWVKTRELSDKYIFETEECITEEAIKKSSAKIFTENTVIIAMYGATIGKLGILASPAATNQACCALIQKFPSYGTNYIYWFLRQYREGLISLGQGAAQQNISQQVIQDYLLLKPEKSVVDSFNQITESIMGEIKVLQRKNDALREARDLLLPRLVSGQLDVSDVEIPN